MGSSPSARPWSVRAAGLNTVIRPSSSHATMPSSRVSNSTWRNCCSRFSSTAAWRTAVTSLKEATAPAMAPSAPNMAWTLVRIHIGGVPLRRSPWTTPTDRRPLRRLAPIGSSLPWIVAPSTSITSTPRARAAAMRSPMRRPRRRTRGASNMTSKASLTRTTEPSASTIITPSASDSMMAVCRRSTSRTCCSRLLCSVMSRTLTTIPPMGSSRWLAATTSRSIGFPSARTVRISRETDRRRRATRSLNRARTGSTLSESNNPKASTPTTLLMS